MRYIKTLMLAFAALAVPAQTMLAVTDKEMEEARAYTAKSYLRYVNNGSGYLDEVNVKTMAELNSKLKAKEKENIAAFNAVKVPQDYAAWDKKQLVEYWAATFFTSPGLDPNGKGARTRVRKYIEGMTVTAPSASEAKPAETAPAPQETPAAVNAEAAPEDGQLAPEDLVAQEPADVLADQNAIEKAAEESRPERPEGQNATWVYVLVLAILIGVVIWLVIYAANLMKRQPDGRQSNDEGDISDSELREQTRKAIATKNQELDQMRKALEEAESRAAALASELESGKRANHQLEAEAASLREEIAKLRSHALQAPEVAKTPVKGPEAPKEAPKQQLLKVIYLGRANKRGIFVRADRRITEGSTIYRLDTNDGLVGTFHVVDEPEVVDLALSDPTEFLANGCSGEDLEDTAGVTRITTQSAGTAIFENGYWKVLRKSRIRYE